MDFRYTVTGNAAAIALLASTLTVATDVPQADAAGSQQSCAKAAARTAKARSDRSRRARRCKAPVSNDTSSGSSVSQSTASAPATPAPPTPPPPPSDPPPPDSPPNPDCALSNPGSDLGLTVSGCRTVSSDTGDNADPIPFWGRIDCQNASRQKTITSGGDSHTAADGTGQPSASFRRTTVFDGDNYYGERCELGINDKDGPTAFYHEGQRRLTAISIRLPNGTDPNSNLWRTVMQMKQAQPYYNPVMAPIFELEVVGGDWMVISDWNEVWRAPAQQNVWTRFAFDVTYSADPSKGSIKTYVDLNGDADADDAGEQSPVTHRATLFPEVAGAPSPYLPGQSIPSHLRAGIYQDPAHSCPSGCSVDFDNVQVLAP